MKYEQKTFLEGTFVCTRFLACARLTTCVGAHMRKLRGNIACEKYQKVISSAFLRKRFRNSFEVRECIFQFVLHIPIKYSKIR